jgi:hypothetical protein
VWTEVDDSGQDTMADFCEHSNDPSGFLKQSGELIYHLNNYLNCFVTISSIDNGMW